MPVPPHSSSAGMLSGGAGPVTRLQTPSSASMFLPRVADTIPVQVQELRDKRVTVAGLGRFGGGIAVARWLVEQGATVLVTDQAPAEKLAESVAKLDGLPIHFRLGDQRESDFSGADLVVASPAIPPASP